MNQLGPIPRRSASLREQVAQHLRDAILEGRVAPGQRLVERELCQALDISRTILREALQQLQAEGLVVTVMHKGPSVAMVGVDEVDEIYEVRQALESLAAAGFARNATNAQIVALREQVEFLKSDKAAESARSLLEAKSGFYAVLFEGCGNRVGAQVLIQLTNRMTLFRRLSLGVPGRIPEMLTELDAIVSAIEARDDRRAAILCATHVANARKTVMDRLNAQSINTAQESHG